VALVMLVFFGPQRTQVPVGSLHVRKAAMLVYVAGRQAPNKSCTTPRLEHRADRNVEKFCMKKLSG